jgi:hypothetical protein
VKFAMIYALLAAILCVLCSTQQAVADITGKTIGLSDAYATRDGRGGFQQVELLDFPGGGLNALSMLLRSSAPGWRGSIPTCSKCFP